MSQSPPLLFIVHWSYFQSQEPLGPYFAIARRQKDRQEFCLEWVLNLGNMTSWQPVLTQSLASSFKRMRLRKGSQSSCAVVPSFFSWFYLRALDRVLVHHMLEEILHSDPNGAVTLRTTLPKVLRWSSPSIPRVTFSRNTSGKADFHLEHVLI